MLYTTAGQLAVNEVLPEDLRDYNRILDKGGIAKLFQQIAEKYPEKYRDIAHKLSQLGYHTAYITGGNSFDLSHIRISVTGKKAQDELRAKIEQIYSDPQLSDIQKEQKVVETLLPMSKKLEDDIFDESLKEKNPLAFQVLSGSRGNKTQLKSLRGPDLLYVDHHERPIPIPILRSYSQGLSPAEYYAGTFGARKGVMDTKFATQDAGFFSKQLNQVAHRLIVTKQDADDPDQLAYRGLPVEIDDPDNEGALLASPVGGYKRNTVLTPKILSDLHSQGIHKILVRSPIVGGPPDGGLYANDVGYRERGGLTPLYDNVGIAAAQALSEPLSQAQLSSKHSGGVAGGTSKGVSGFKLVNQLVQVPKTFRGGAAHAQVDGKVQSIDPAPQGGTYITINGHKHYVGQGYNVNVKRGQDVEAGDILSEGIPNPAEVVKHKGIGEGRRYFMHAFRNAYKESGMPYHRRNIEIMSRGLIDHVRMTDEYGDYNPGDIVSYSRLEHYWKPREGYDIVEPKRAANMYLEKPVLHYSIGTKVRPSVINHLNEFGIKNVVVHRDPPPFEPEMIRGMENLAHDPDWMTRFLGSHLQKNLLKGVHRGDIADEVGTSYVPGLARAADFGRKGIVKPWKLTDIKPKQDIVSAVPLN
jgi:hypothetical protein